MILMVVAVIVIIMITIIIMIITMSMRIINIRTLAMVIYIFGIVNNSFASYNTYHLRFSLLVRITCQWRLIESVSSDKKYWVEIFRNCSKLYLRFYDCIFGSYILIKITFDSFETIYHFERTFLKIRVL